LRGALMRRTGDRLSNPLARALLVRAVKE
jgi:hypothetical protein